MEDTDDLEGVVSEFAVQNGKSWGRVEAEAGGQQQMGGGGKGGIVLSSQVALVRRLRVRVDVSC